MKYLTNILLAAYAAITAVAVPLSLTQPICVQLTGTCSTSGGSTQACCAGLKCVTPQSAASGVGGTVNGAVGGTVGVCIQSLLDICIPAGDLCFTGGGLAGTILASVPKCCNSMQCRPDATSGSSSIPGSGLLGSGILGSVVGGIGKCVNPTTSSPVPPPQTTTRSTTTPQTTTTRVNPPPQTTTTTSVAPPPQTTTQSVRPVSTPPTGLPCLSIGALCLPGIPGLTGSSNSLLQLGSCCGTAKCVVAAGVSFGTPGRCQ